MTQLRNVVLLPRPRHIYPASGGVNPARQKKTLPAQGYRITIDPRGPRIESADDAGAFYAAQTLKQLRRMCPGRLPRGVIEDWPDFPVRGVMLDISRDKVPTMKTLFKIVDLLAELKINHLELYMEHTFAYRRHRDVWKNASPMTPKQIRALDKYCRARFIELVPNQNTFGHMHRWLDHPRYRALAICPDGYVTPWKERRTTTSSLNPLDPRSIALVRELLAELLPCFTSNMVNVGCDETFDLGQGKTEAACRRRGTGRIYLDYLLNVHKVVKKLGHTMHFWGDIILNHPELISKLPRDVVPLVWGYEATHPFNKQCAAFARAGLAYYVCPGTSAWNSVAGRTDNCLKNLTSAAENGLRHGARGYLITDWGDNGHWQPLPVSYLGYSSGASMSWCLKANRRVDWAKALDAHVFLDRAGVMGDIAMNLGNAYLKSGRPLHNASALFRLLHQNDIQKLADEIGRRKIERSLLFIDAATRPLKRARMKRGDRALILREFDLASRMLRFACGRALKQDPRRLAHQMDGILGEYARIWRARNRPGGLSDSMARLRQRRKEC